MLLKLENTLMHKLRAVKQFMMVSVIGASLIFPLKAMDIDEAQANSLAKRTLSLAQFPNDIMPFILSPLSGDALCALWATGDKTMHYHLKTKAQVFEIDFSDRAKSNCFNAPGSFPCNLSDQFPHLTILKLSNITNNKRHYLERITLPLTLRVLDITNCHLSRLPNTLSQLSNLTALKMCGNTIEGIDLLTQLETLECTLGNSEYDINTDTDTAYDINIFTRIPQLRDLSLELDPRARVVIPSTILNLNVYMWAATVLFEEEKYVLETLILRGNPDDVLEDDIINKNIKLSYLKSLSVSNMYTFGTLQFIPNFAPSLVELSIIPCEDAPDIGQMFQVISSLTQLEKLSLVGNWISKCSNNNPAHFTNMTRSLPNFTDLSLNHKMLPKSILTGQIFQTLKNLSRLENLTLYDFSSNTYSDMMMLPNVKSLKLLGTKFNNMQQFPVRYFALLPSSLTSFQIDRDYFAELESIHWGLLEPLPCPGLKWVYVGDQYFPTTPASSRDKKRPSKESEYEDYNPGAKRHKGS